jgi:hypothetical protein
VAAQSYIYPRHGSCMSVFAYLKAHQLVLVRQCSGKVYCHVKHNVVEKCFFDHIADFEGISMHQNVHYLSNA